MHCSGAENWSQRTKLRENVPNNLFEWNARRTSKSARVELQDTTGKSFYDLWQQISMIGISILQKLVCNK